MNFANVPIDPAMIITKELSKSDIVNNVTLPKEQVFSVAAKMHGVTYESLQNGVQVQVLDMVENDLYTVTLKLSENGTFYFGSGWSTMKHSLDLSEGDVLKLFWDQSTNKFLILNVPYTINYGLVNGH